MPQADKAGEKRAADAAPAEAAAPAKQAKVDLNPLTGAPYTQRFYHLLERRQRLPAWQAREEFLKLMMKGQVVLVVGETCSGKTTQLPQILLDAGYHVQNSQIRSLACVQPYDAAATSAAHRIAEELEVPLGSYVGYHIRFDDKTSADTLLRLVTAEAVVREIIEDPHLQKYSVILIDEAHTRTAFVDLVLGLLKIILANRPELKLVIMSPSTEIKRMQNYFGGAPLLMMPNKLHPVELYHMNSGHKDYLKAAVQTVLQIHSQEPEGDILVFFTTEEDIEVAQAHLRREALRVVEFGELVCVVLHANSSPAQMLKVFEPAPGPKLPGGKGGRKVILSTPIGETAIPLEGVMFVVDPGFEQQRFYNPRTRLESKHAAPASKATIERRAARAGGVAPGKCFRLFPEKAFKDQIPEVVFPEVMRTNLTSLVLTMKRLGVDDLVHFEFLDPPPPEAIMRALDHLGLLGCISEEGDVTDVGDKICKFPLEPQVGKMLVESPRHRCSNEALSIASMLSVRPVFLRPTGAAKQADEARGRFAHLDGDHLTLLNVFHAYKQHVQDGVDPAKFCGENYISLRALAQAERIREQLKKIMDQLGLQMVSTDFQDKEYYPNIRRCILSGFFTQVAHLDKEKLGLYLTMREAQEVSLHPTTSLQHKPEWVVYDEFLFTSRPFVRTITQIRPEWFLDIAPSYYDLQKWPRAETKAALEKVVARRAGGAAAPGGASAPAK